MTGCFWVVELSAYIMPFGVFAEGHCYCVGQIFAGWGFGRFGIGGFERLGGLRDWGFGGLEDWKV